MIRRDLRSFAHLVSRACCLAALLGATTSLADIAVPAGPHVEMRGSLAMGTVARGVAEQYMGEHPDAVVTVSGGGTFRGLKSVIVGTADMAMGTDPVPDELAKLALSRRVTLESHPIFSDAVVAVVNPKNPIANLSMRELRDVFSGSIVRWADLGVELGASPRGGAGSAGGDGVARARGAKSDAGRSADADSGASEGADIEVVTFAGNIGPYETFKQEVLGDDHVITPRAREVEFRDFEASIGVRAIGYTGLHSVGQLKALKIDGVVPSSESVRSGRYPIARKLSIFVKKPAPPPVTSLLEYFLAKDKGQRIAESLGNVPVE
jgi:phosphate transport system substrate-binding protein